VNILSMYATFGKLVKKELKLAEGLNVIYGENEAGKSTWCDFTRAMLFGISTSEKSKKGYLPDKEKYLPWSGGQMYGRIEISHQGKEYIIERKSGKNGVLGDASVIDKKTGLAVPGMSASPGEAILGVKRQVFERSAFIGQACVQIENDKDGELQRRIISLAGSGDETASYSVVSKRLSEWRNKRRYNKSGDIPRLVDEISGISEKLERLREDAKILTAGHTELAELTVEEQKYENQAALIKGFKAKEQLERCALAARDEQSARDEYMKALENATFDGFVVNEDFLQGIGEKYGRYSAHMNNMTGEELIVNAKKALDAETEKLGLFDMFNGLTGREAKEKAAADSRYIAGVRESLSRTKRAGVFGAAAGVVLLVISAVCAALIPGAGMLLAAAGALAGVLCAAAAGIIGSRKTKTLKSMISRLLSIYRVQDEAGITARADEYDGLLSRVGEAEKVYKQATENTMLYKNRAEALKAEILAEAGRLKADATLEDVPELIERARRAVKDLNTAKYNFESARIRAASVGEGRDLEELRKAAQLLPENINPPETGEDEVSEKLSAIKIRRRELELAISAVSARMSEVGDIAALEAEERQKQEELNKKTLEYEAIEAALEHLAQAHGELQNRFAPELENRAGGIFEKLTGGSFSIVKIKNRDMQLTVSESRAAPPREELQLSAGTLNELYLSLRLALCEIAVDTGIPVILDDALVTFDDKRMSYALEYLSDMAKERQILLYTCHKREYEYLGDRANVIRL
jgi:uncharacterized protein YhaN